MISFRPATHLLRRSLRAKVPSVEATAVDRWEVAPETRRYIHRAVFLPGQLERIRDTEFASIEAVVRAFRGDHDSVEGATWGYRLENVDLVDGVLYSQDAQKPLRPRRRRFPAYLVPREIRSGALYESWVGNRWFGNWLSDDCLTYRLAERYGSPVTTNRSPAGHVPCYEDLLGLTPDRIDRVHFKELILFDDVHNNDDRKKRATDLRDRLISGCGIDPARHPGVFLLRHSTGMRRVLTNEAELAEQLARSRAFQILDPSVSTVEEIVKACAGANCVVGVEGSHLVHGMVVMPPDATLLVLQPPTRVVAALKLLTDRQGQKYGFVIGEDTGADEFIVSGDELLATLDLALT